MHLTEFKLFARSANKGNARLISKKTINPQPLIWVNHSYHLYSVKCKETVLMLSPMSCFHQRGCSIVCQSNLNGCPMITGLPSLQSNSYLTNKQINNVPKLPAYKEQCNQTSTIHLNKVTIITISGINQPNQYDNMLAFI